MLPPLSQAAAAHAALSLLSLAATAQAAPRTLMPSMVSDVSAMLVAMTTYKRGSAFQMHVD